MPMHHITSWPVNCNGNKTKHSYHQQYGGEYHRSIAMEHRLLWKDLSVWLRKEAGCA